MKSLVFTPFTHPEYMKTPLTMACCLYAFVAFAQKKIEIPTYRPSDTSFWYKRTLENIRKAKLEDLTTSATNFHLRFWSEKQVIEIWSTDMKLFHGRLVNYTRRYDHGDHKAKPSGEKEFFSNKEMIDSPTVAKVYDLFTGLAIFSIPVQDSIPYWGDGFDGNTYIIEHSTPDSYSFRAYWSPEVFEHIPEAVTMTRLIGLLKSLLSMENKWNRFVDQLPKGCYYAGGIALRCNDKKPKP